MKSFVKTFLFFLIIIIFSFNLSAQTTNHSRSTFICSYYGESISGPLIGFNSSSDAQNVIAGIMDVIGLQPNFQIRSANIPNAAAVISAGQRYILYNPQFIAAVNNAAKDKWASIAILAHEIGHHLNGHTLSANGSRPSVELEADQFSGFVLRKMGASLAQSQKAMQLIGSNNASLTHPARADRLASIEKGWVKAETQITGKTPAIQSAPNNINTAVPVNTSSAYVLDPQFIKYNVVFKNDSEQNYYVTIRNNLVTILNNQIVVLGKLFPTNNTHIPYLLQIGNDNKLYVTKSGAIINSSGAEFGYFK